MMFFDDYEFYSEYEAELYPKTKGFKKVHSTKRAGQMEIKLKKVIHFIERTGKLPQRYSNDEKEREYYSVVSHVGKEGAYEKYPELRNKLRELVRRLKEA